MGGVRAHRQRRLEPAQRVLHHDIVTVGGQQDADRRTVTMLRTPQQIVDGVDVEAQRAQVSRFDPAGLQLEHDKTAQPEMKKQQIDEELLLPHRQPVLPAHEREPVAKLGEEVRHPRDEGVFQLPLGVSGVQCQEVQVVGVLDDFPRQVRLPRPQGGREVVGCRTHSCVPVRRDVMGQHRPCRWSPPPARVPGTTQAIMGLLGRW